MKKQKKEYPATASCIGEKILNILIVPAILLLIMTFVIMVRELSWSAYTEFSPHNRLYMLEDKDYGGLVSSYYTSYANILKGKDEKEKALRSTAEYIEAAFLHYAAAQAGDAELEEQQAGRMQQAYNGMGMYAEEADNVEHILETY